MPHKLLGIKDFTNSYENVHDTQTHELSARKDQNDPMMKIRT